MSKIRLGVNIDHVATIRNARGENYPDPLRAALVAQKYGADSITIHLREDRRHIRDHDLKNIIKRIKIPLNLEMAPTKQMLNTAIKYKPSFVCIVPEKRQEVTTEGGLNLNKNQKKLKFIINKLKKKNIRVTLFVEPKISDIKTSKNLGANCVELHTGKFCNLFNTRKNIKNAFINLKNAAYYADKIGLEVHAGHGLSYITAKKIIRIKAIKELNTGHFLVAESVFIGLRHCMKNFINILRK